MGEVLAKAGAIVVGIVIFAAIIFFFLWYNGWLYKLFDNIAYERKKKKDAEWLDAHKKLVDEKLKEQAMALNVLVEKMKPSSEIQSLCKRVFQDGSAPSLIQISTSGITYDNRSIIFHMEGYPALKDERLGSAGFDSTFVIYDEVNAVGKIIYDYATGLGYSYRISNAYRRFEKTAPQTKKWY